VTRLLVRAADWCATFDDDDTELAHADVLVGWGAARVHSHLEPGCVVSLGTTGSASNAESPSPT
jgi:hypothetical protein